MSFSERLYSAFGDRDIGWEAAKAIGEIASSDTVLTKANHAEIKVEYVTLKSNNHLTKVTGSFCAKIRWRSSAPTH